MKPIRDKLAHVVAHIAVLLVTGSWLFGAIIGPFLYSDHDPTSGPGFVDNSFETLPFVDQAIINIVSVIFLLVLAFIFVMTARNLYKITRHTKI